MIHEIINVFFQILFFLGFFLSNFISIFFFAFFFLLQAFFSNNFHRFYLLKLNWLIIEFFYLIQVQDFMECDF